ncbi:hypothetical protein PQX77_010108 [Marasmius sp. AFHP31]|nr:hypothetical protein PQX77_010108 [Marasmius sp. AFHP31]
MKTFRPRHLRYFTLRHPYPIHDLSEVPTQLPDPQDMIQLKPDLGISTDCVTSGVLPDDGSCLNLVIEEPLSIMQLEGGDRFRAREITLFLKEYEVEIYPRGVTDLNIGSSWMHDSEPIWSKTVPESEAQVREAQGPRPWCSSCRSTPYSVLPAPNGRLSHHNTLLWRSSERIPTPQYTLTLGWASHPETRTATVHGHSLLALPQHTWVGSWARGSLAQSEVQRVLVITPHQVLLWYDWEDEWKSSEGTTERPRPPKYNPRKADAWAMGNVVTILVDTVLDD